MITFTNAVRNLFKTIAGPSFQKPTSPENGKSDNILNSYDPHLSPANGFGSPQDDLVRDIVDSPSQDLFQVNQATFQLPDEDDTHLLTKQDRWILPIPRFENRSFNSYKEIVAYCNRYCAGHEDNASQEYSGYAVSITSSNRIDKDRSKPFANAMLGCNLGKRPRNGANDEVDFESGIKRRRNRRALACNCPFKISTWCEPSRGLWFAKTLIDYHNHPPQPSVDATARTRKPPLTDLSESQRLNIRELRVPVALKLLRCETGLPINSSDIQYMKKVLQARAVEVIQATLENAKIRAINNRTLRNGRCL